MATIQDLHSQIREWLESGGWTREELIDEVDAVANWIEDEKEEEEEHGKTEG